MLTEGYISLFGNFLEDRRERGLAFVPEDTGARGESLIHPQHHQELLSCAVVEKVILLNQRFLRNNDRLLLGKGVAS